MTQPPGPIEVEVVYAAATHRVELKRLCLPAGSTAASLLAAAGLRVLVLEREQFPRFHIGESLLPIDLPLFERLGLTIDAQASTGSGCAAFASR